MPSKRNEEVWLKNRVTTWVGVDRHSARLQLAFLIDRRRFSNIALGTEGQSAYG
jgi:hypothetical protein